MHLAGKAHISRRFKHACWQCVALGAGVGLYFGLRRRRQDKYEAFAGVQRREREQPQSEPQTALGCFSCAFGCARANFVYMSRFLLLVAVQHTKLTALPMTLRAGGGRAATKQQQSGVPSQLQRQ